MHKNAYLVIRYPIYAPYTNKNITFTHIGHELVIFWMKYFSWNPLRTKCFFMDPPSGANFFPLTPSKQLPHLPVLNYHSLNRIYGLEWRILFLVNEKGVSNFNSRKPRCPFLGGAPGTYQPRIILIFSSV